MTIGETIRKIREERGMTQEDLSRKLGYKTKSSVSKIEKGLAEFPISKLRKIADALDVDVWEIIGFNNVVMDDLDRSDVEGLTMDEKQILDLYRNLTDEGKEYIFKTLLMAQNTMKKSDED